MPIPQGPADTPERGRAGTIPPPSTRSTVPTCRTCIHHVPSQQDLALVECRRHPPTLCLTPPTPGGSPGMMTGFPLPRGDWWCSEHTGSLAVPERAYGVSVERPAEEGAE